MTATVEVQDLEVGMKTELGIVTAVYSDAVDFVSTVDEFKLSEIDYNEVLEIIEQYDFSDNPYELLDFYGFVDG